MALKRVLVPIAEGVEELEAVCMIDVLRRAGAVVTVASVNDLMITASRGVRIQADCLISACVGNPFDLIALPGGIPGAEHLRDSENLAEMLKDQKRSGRLYAAICASPAVVLGFHGLLDERRATCHPFFSNRPGGLNAVEEPVVVDGNCITSRGPGTALLFALTLVELLFGREKRNEVAEPMILY